MMHGIVLFGFALLASAPALAETRPDAPAAEKKICRQSEASTGSLMTHRVCKTAAEWKKEQAEAQRQTVAVDPAMRREPGIVR